MEDEYEQRISDLQTDLNIIRQRLQVKFVVVVVDVVIGNIYIIVDNVVVFSMLLLLILLFLFLFFVHRCKLRFLLTQVGRNYRQNGLMLLVMSQLFVVAVRHSLRGSLILLMIFSFIDQIKLIGVLLYNQSIFTDPFVVQVPRLFNLINLFRVFQEAEITNRATERERQGLVSQLTEQNQRLTSELQVINFFASFIFQDRIIM